MTLASKFGRLQHRLRRERLSGLPGWIWRWLYWNAGLYRLARRAEAAPVRLNAPADTPTPHPICDDIYEWCQRTPGAAYQVLAPRHRLQRHPPHTLEAEPHPSFAGLLNVDVPERALVSVPGARVAGESGLVVLPDGAFAGELVALTPAGRRTMLLAQPAFQAPLPTPARRLAGPYCLLSTIGWANYYHWNHDVIMRLIGVLPSLPAEVRFLVPAHIKDFHYEGLALLGINRERLEPLASDEVVEVETLYFVTPIHKTQITSPEATQWFRAAALARYGLTAQPARRRLYLERPRELDSHYRVVNEAAVRACLERYGFETVHPHTMTFEAQARLFSQAQVLAGTGTGLANMWFAPAGALVLQFQEPSKTIHALWTLSEALGHQYWYVLCRTVPNPNPAQALPDIDVPIERLERTVEQMLSQNGLAWQVSA